MNNTYDVIIIGAGFAGLTAGALLAKSGQKVLVLDQHYVVGGCVSMFRRKQFNFDAAVHLIGGCGPGGPILSLYQQLGLDGQIEFIEVDPMYHLRIGETEYEIPANLDSFAQRMGEWFPEDRDAVNEVIEEIKIISQALFTGNLEQVGPRVQELSMQSFGDYLEGRFQNPRTSLVLSSLHPYAGVNIRKLSTLFMFSMLASYHDGAYYPRGGSQKMSQLLSEYICQNGGQVLLRRKVEQIIYDGNRVRGVIDQKGNRYEANTIISNADLLTTMTKLLDERALPDEYRQGLRKLKPSHSAVILYAAIKNTELPHELFLFPNHQQDDDSKYLYDPSNAESDPFILVCCPSAVDSSLAPEGYSVLSGMVIADYQTIEDYRKAHGKEALENQLIQLIDSKIPNFKEKLVHYELATPSTIERFTRNQKGAIYGWMKSYDQPWIEAIGPTTPINGLYLASHWLPNIHGVIGACLAGQMVAGIISQANK
jgi:phytoene dehydrogenase-like protein